MAEINSTAVAGNQQLALVLEGMLTDLTNLKSTVDTAVSKLNADGGVSDTDYASSPALVTT